MPPTWIKDYDNSALAEIWRMAQKQLADADELVFLGYSLREDDWKVKELFRNAEHTRGRKWRRVVVVNKSLARVRHRYGKVFGKIAPVTAQVSDYLLRSGKFSR